MKLSNSLKIVGFAVAGLALTGCTSLPGATAMSFASTPSTVRPPNEHNGVSGTIYLAAQTLIDRAGTVDTTRPIAVATVVDVDNLTASSTFGRLSSAVIASRISQRGYNVRDVTFTQSLMLHPQTGELVLSRDASRVVTSLNAQAVVAGTYAVGGENIYLNLRLLSADRGEILSSVDVMIPIDDDTLPLIEPAYMAAVRASRRH